MNAFLKREFYILKHNFIPFICIWALMPMAVYLFISYPLHSLLKTHSSGINYLHWSSIGNLIFTSSLLAYFMSLNSTLKYKSKSNFSNAMLVSPQPNSRHLIAIVIWSSAVAFIQLLFSVGITQSLNSSLSTTNILWVILYLIPIIIMMSNIGIFIGLIVSNSIARIFLIIIFIIFFLGASGLFIELNITSSSLLYYSPFHLAVLHTQNIVTGDISMPSPSIIVFIVSILLFFINLVLSHKMLRS